MRKAYLITSLVLDTVLLFFSALFMFTNMMTRDIDAHPEIFFFSCFAFLILQIISILGLSIKRMKGWVIALCKIAGVASCIACYFIFV